MTRARPRALRARPRSGWVVGLVLLVGCATSYTSVSDRTRGDLVARRYDDALTALDEVEKGGDALLVALERGLVLHYAADYVASNEAFETAERLIDELYTKSLSVEIASLVTSDALRPYDGATFERVMVHVYRALNYIALDAPQSALVEARKANANLELYTDDLADPLYRDDAFVQYVTGLLYADAGEWNDAYVSFQKAEAIYAAQREDGGPRVPEVLVEDLLTTAARLGRSDDVVRWRERYPDVVLPEHDPSHGTVLVLVESGFVPALSEARIDVPILKTDSREEHDVWLVAGSAYRRVHHRRRPPRAELAYLLSIAYPVFTDVPARVREVDVAVAPSASDPDGVSAGSPALAPVRAVRVSDLAANAERSFRDRESSILIRTIARALLKYIARRKAEDAGGKGLGLVVDILGSVTERADVRSWRNLPRDVFLARMTVPAGIHDLTLTSRSGGGGVVERVTLTGVEVDRGRTRWVSYRLFD